MIQIRELGLLSLDYISGLISAVSWIVQSMLVGSSGPVDTFIYCNRLFFWTAFWMMLWSDLCQCCLVWAWGCRKTFHFVSSSSVLIPTMGRRGRCCDYIIIPRPRQAGKQWSATTFLFLKYIRRVQSSDRSVVGIKHQRSFRHQFKAVRPMFQSSRMLLGPFSVWVLTRVPEQIGP